MKISNIVSTLLLGAMVAFSGCGSDEDEMMNPETTYTYSVTLTNVTAGQPMAPVIVTSNSIFSIGESASIALEKLAEGGDNSELLDSNGVSGAGLAPGASETLTLTTASKSISIATMLVKTNDGFAGINDLDLSSLNVGESKTSYALVYDAGTEANSETNTTVAAFGVEGFNADRDDNDMVTLHSGVISNEDGLATSALSAQEKFNSQALYVNVTRTK